MEKFGMICMKNTKEISMSYSIQTIELGVSVVMYACNAQNQQQHFQPPQLYCTQEEHKSMPA